MPSLNQISELEIKQLSSNTLQHMSHSTNSNQFELNSFMSTQNFSQIGNSSSSSATIDNAILPQNVLSEHRSPDRNALRSKKIEVSQSQSTSVVPVVYMSDPNASLSCNSTEIQNDLLKPIKIQIKCQPRSKFRPRTQNESKNASHYLRCEDGAEHDYPSIYVPTGWARQSDTNIIEVALTDFKRQPHPYAIDNKVTRHSFDDGGLIFKRNEPNILYFRLTNEDFVNGFKTFMIELIKSKQDDVITKTLIRQRKLDQSMLRFTRIYRDESGQCQRDLNSEEYSCLMTENYGDVSVEHVGPQYGPMSGQETMFIVFKGRIAKEDLSVNITEPTTGWSHDFEKFSINGSFIHFSIPAFPYPQMIRANANITIYFKQQAVHECTYLYTTLIDQELAISNSDIGVSLTSNNMYRPQVDILTSRCPTALITQKTSKSKSIKRLNSK